MGDDKKTRRLLPGATGTRKKRTPRVRSAADDEATEVMSRPGPASEAPSHREETSVRTIADVENTQLMPSRESLGAESTVVMEAPAHAKKSKGTGEGAGREGDAAKRRKGLRSFAIALAVLVIAWDTLFPEEDDEKKIGLLRVQIELPTPGPGEDDPAKSQRYYDEGLRSYLADTVEGYARAAKFFEQSYRHEPANTRALAFLASCYLNLLENSQKDENAVLSVGKILEMIKARKTDLAETMIAQIEYALLTRAYRTAEQLIADYTRTRKYELEMYYYFALTKFLQGDAATAVRYLNEIPDDKVYSPRVFYLRGEIARKLNRREEALAQYKLALQVNPNHARSLLRFVEIMAEDGKVQSTGPMLANLVTHPQTMTPQELGETFFHVARLKLSENKPRQAEDALERAIRIQPENAKFLLEYYAVKSDRSQSPETLRGKARMYYYLSRGEALLSEEKFREALDLFLRAREASIDSAAPLRRMGDAFFALSEFTNAARSYEKAVKLSPRDLTLNARWVRALIRNYDFDEARRAIANLGRLPKSKSTSFRLQGELAMREERYIDALAFFKQGLREGSADPALYLLYAEGLYQLRQFNDALFFFALARRSGQYEADAILGQARSKGQIESWDGGVQFLEEEMARMGKSPAPLMVAMAEMVLARGDLPVAQKWVDQVIKDFPQNAEVWGVQMKIHLMMEEKDPRKFLENAIRAVSRQIELAPGNVAPRLERFKLFVRKTDFARAMQELNDIYAMYKKYPNLHFQRGNLFSLMGNPKSAIEEYREELKSHPDNVNAVLALGNEHLKAKNLDEALRLFSEGMRLAPKSGEPRQLAGYVQFLKKDYDAAVALLLSAVELDPGNPTGYKRLGAAFRGQGNNDRAREAFKKYLELFPDAPDRAEFENIL